MGIPYVEAPCEAEAQCAALARDKKVYAAASEDMDTLTFSAPILLRHLTFSEARKLPIDEIHLNKVLEGLNFTMEQVSYCLSCLVLYIRIKIIIFLLNSLWICVFFWVVIIVILLKALAHIERLN
jgi:hypothetical protein